MKVLCMILSVLFLFTMTGCSEISQIGGFSKEEPVVEEQEVMEQENVVEEVVEATEDTVECANCKAELTADAKFCAACGEEVVEPLTECPVCGDELAANAKFCSGCGFDLTADPSHPEGVPEDAVELNGHYYYIYSGKDAASYASAKAFCEKQGGYLAVISSREENDFLYELMEENDYGGAYFAHKKSGDKWSWEGKEKSSYSNFAENIFDYAQPEDQYAMLCMTHDTGRWIPGNGVISDRQTYRVPIVSAEATSHLVEPDVVQVAGRCIDGKTGTSWVEGAAGQGIGESITFYFDQQPISGFAVYGGYQKTTDLYKANSRPKELYVTLSNYASDRIFMEDFKYYQTFDVDTSDSVYSLTMEIRDAYPGSRFEDTTISEVTIFSAPANTGFLCEWAP